MGCYFCDEPLSSYGFRMINGKERKVCITCENVEHKYQKGNFGTPIENCLENDKFRNFKIGDKIEGEFCKEWYKARIYSIEIFKTPKGDITHYLCYYEHHYCYDKTKELIEGFGWFEYVRFREEKAELVDNDNFVYSDIECCVEKKKRKFGSIEIKDIPKKILKLLSCGKQTTLTL